MMKRRISNWQGICVCIIRFCSRFNFRQSWFPSVRWGRGWWGNLSSVPAVYNHPVNDYILFSMVTINSGWCKGVREGRLRVGGTGTI